MVDIYQPIEGIHPKLNGNKIEEVESRRKDPDSSQLTFQFSHFLIELVEFLFQGFCFLGVGLTLFIQLF